MQRDYSLLFHKSVLLEGSLSDQDPVRIYHLSITHLSNIRAVSLHRLLAILPCIRESTKPDTRPTPTTVAVSRRSGRAAVVVAAVGRGKEFFPSCCRRRLRCGFTFRFLVSKTGAACAFHLSSAVRTFTIGQILRRTCHRIAARFS